MGGNNNTGEHQGNIAEDIPPVVGVIEISNALGI